jgi:hypothetical protein
VLVEVVHRAPLGHAQCRRPSMSKQERAHWWLGRAASLPPYCTSNAAQSVETAKATGSGWRDCCCKQVTMRRLAAGGSVPAAWSRRSSPLVDSSRRRCRRPDLTRPYY